MITLPEKFANDIQGKDTFLTTLIILNDQDEDESKRIYLSTGRVTLDGIHYDPFIKSLGSIKQSINISKQSIHLLLKLKNYLSNVKNVNFTHIENVMVFQKMTLNYFFAFNVGY